MGIVTMALVVVVGMLANAMRTLRDSEDDTKIPDLVQQTVQITRRELSRHDWFKDPAQNNDQWEKIGSEYQREYFFSINQILQNDDTFAEGKEEIYYRILAKLKDPPRNLNNIPPQALKTLILQVDWPYNKDTQKSLNTRTYTLLLHNDGYQSWKEDGGGTP